MHSIVYSGPQMMSREVSGEVSRAVSGGKRREWSGFVGIGLVEVGDEFRSMRVFRCW